MSSAARLSHAAARSRTVTEGSCLGPVRLLGMEKPSGSGSARGSGTEERSGNSTLLFLVLKNVGHPRIA